MKKLALAVSVLAISAVGASAADMAPVYTKAPALVPSGMRLEFGMAYSRVT